MPNGYVTSVNIMLRFALPYNWITHSISNANTEIFHDIINEHLQTVLLEQQT